MSSKRVLLLSPNIGFHMGLGGGCRVAAIMAEVLAKRGLEVIIVSLRGLPIEIIDRIHRTKLSKFKSEGLVKEAYVLGYGSPPRIPFPLALKLIVLHLRRLISKYNPIILIFHDDVPKSIEVLNYQLNRIRVMLYSHFPYAARVLLNVYEPWEVLLERQLSILQRAYRALLKRELGIPLSLDVKLISNSTVTKKFVEYLWRRHADILYPPVKYPTIAMSSNSSVSTKQDIVLVLAPLQPNKRIGEVIEAFSKCCKGKLIIAGWAADHDYVKYLQRKIRKLGLNERVKMYLNVTEDLKWRLLARAKVIVSASHFEPFGISIVEGMLSKAVPVVRKTSLSGPWIDIVCFGRYGFGFYDLEELSSIIDELISNDKLFKEYSEIAYARGFYFSTERFAVEFLSKINEILGGSVETPT